MGTDGGMPGHVNRANSTPSSDPPLLARYLSLEPISLGSQKYMRSGELRRALGFPLVSASEDHLSRVSSSKPSTPVATEDLKQLRESVQTASIQAKERSKIFCSSVNKLDKLTETIGSKKRQRSDVLLEEKPGGSTFLKTAGQPPHNYVDQSAQRLEDRAKCSGMNKRFRSPTVDKMDHKSGSLSNDQMSNEKDLNVTKSVSGPSVHPEERILRLSAGEGWDRNMKRKRSVGTVISRLTDNDAKRMMHTKLSTDVKLASCDNAARLSGRANAKLGNSTGSPVKGKISRAPRTGSVMSVNSSDIQASQTDEGGEQPTSTNKMISLGLIQNQHMTANSSPQMLSKWVGQRQQKSSRSRRTNLVSPVSNNSEGQISSLNCAPTAVGVRSTLNGSSGCLDSVDTHCTTIKKESRVDSAPSPGLLSEAEESRGLDHGLEEKGKDIREVALNGKGKVRAFVFPTKRNKNFHNENDVDGVRRQGRTVRGISQSEGKLDNMSTIKRTTNTRPSSEKMRSKSGRPPAKRMSDGRGTRNSECDDDREELLAAAASARKADNLCCSGHFWKKMEPVFGSVSEQDASYLKQQLIFAKDLEDSQSLMPVAEGVLMHEERTDLSSGKKGSDSNQVVDKDEMLPVGLGGGRRVDKISSLYQRVLSALIQEDENEGLYNGYEGVSMSFQCASDDSHCGSCNYADAETRDRDRFDSEAESILDFQIQKRYAGDRMSCNKSITSNTSWTTNMSDSLYSSGRWLGDDGLSYSDSEFISGSCQNDMVGPLPVDVTASGTLYDCQYQFMCVDDRIVLELQSIGLYPDAMPDLTEGEVIDQYITELKEGLYEQIGKRKHSLVKIDRLIQVDKESEKMYMEQVALEQLIQMAYKRRMACRRNNASKTIMRRVSKQVAMGFIERTLARCRTFEVTGRSCFSEPALQELIFATPQNNDTGVSIATDGHTDCGATKTPNAVKADSLSITMPGSCTDDLGKESGNPPKVASHSSEHGRPITHKSRKRELLLDDVGGASSRGYGSSLVGGAKGKRSERDRVPDNSRSSLADSICKNQSTEGSRIEEKSKTKLKINSASAVEPLSSSIQQQRTGKNKRAREMWLPASQSVAEACEDAEGPCVVDSMMPFDISNDPSAPDDLNSWLNMDGLLDVDDASAGLDIPMDDLSQVF